MAQHHSCKQPAGYSFLAIYLPLGGCHGYGFRALAIYLFLVVVFKVAGRRALLQMTSFDLILLLIISEATQQALLGRIFGHGRNDNHHHAGGCGYYFWTDEKYFSPVENIRMARR